MKESNNSTSKKGYNLTAIISQLPQPIQSEINEAILLRKQVDYIFGEPHTDVPDTIKCLGRCIIQRMSHYRFAGLNDEARGSEATTLMWLLEGICEMGKIKLDPYNSANAEI